MIVFLKRKMFFLSRSDYVCRETFETFGNVNLLENKVLVFFVNIKYKNNITIHPKWNPFPTPKLYLFLHILPHEDMLHTFHICDATNELIQTDCDVWIEYVETWVLFDFLLNHILTCSLHKVFVWIQKNVVEYSA